jgi:glycosyltransferase involved in cell wall biosynthesis
MPYIVPPLVAALKGRGYTVDVEPWGRRVDQESLVRKLITRAADVIRIARVLRSGRYDVLLVQTTHTWQAVVRDVVLLLACRHSERRDILHMHGGRPELLLRRSRPLLKAVNRVLLRLCAAVIVSSRSEQEALMIFSPGTRVWVADNIYVPRQAEVLSETPHQWNLPPDTPLLVFAARLIPEKGVLDLLDALPQVLRSARCHLLLAGVGPLEEEVRARLAEDTLRDRVTWVRYLDRAQLELAYSLCDVFVLPTYHCEGFPAVIQDALGHGLPIVTTSTRGLADHLVDGLHAMMVRPRDPVALAAALVHLLRDADLRWRMAAANHAKAADFAADRVVLQYDAVLQEAVQEGRAVR